MGNSLFDQSINDSGTYRAPCHKKYNKTLDYILVRVDQREEMTACFVWREDELYALTDHRMVVADIEIRQRVRDGDTRYSAGTDKKTRTPINIEYKSLKDTATFHTFDEQLKQTLRDRQVVERLEAIGEGEGRPNALIEVICNDYMECIQVTATTTLPTQLKQRKQDNWFTAAKKELQPLIDQKIQAYRACKVAWEDKSNNRDKDDVAKKEAIYKRAVRQAKLACQLARERYYSDAEADLEALFNSNNMCGNYQAVLRFITPKFKPIGTSGQMGGLYIPGIEGEADRRVESPEEVLREWKEYFSTLLN